MKKTGSYQTKVGAFGGRLLGLKIIIDKQSSVKTESSSTSVCGQTFGSFEASVLPSLNSFDSTHP